MGRSASLLASQSGVLTLNLPKRSKACRILTDESHRTYTGTGSPGPKPAFSPISVPVLRATSELRPFSRVATLGNSEDLVVTVLRAPRIDPRTDNGRAQGESEINFIASCSVHSVKGFASQKSFVKLVRIAVNTSNRTRQTICFN